MYEMKRRGLIVLLAMLSFLGHMAFATPVAETTIEVPVTTKDAIGNMLLQSVSLIGISYRWGGNTPETGMDCSGFIRYLYKTSLGINLPRTASEMARVGKRISIDKIEPGDLLFFNTRRGANTHVGMYLGNNKMIVAPRSGLDIQITELTRYYRSKFNGAKRIIQENEDDDGNTTIETFEETREFLPGGRYKKRSVRHTARKSHQGNKKWQHSSKVVSVSTKTRHTNHAPGKIRKVEIKKVKIKHVKSKKTKAHKKTRTKVKPTARVKKKAT